jgi:hypothetical protein
MLRKVMVSDLRLGDGIILPKACDISMLTFSIQSDGGLFEDPFKLDPFRYSRIREDVSSTTDDHGNQSNGPTTNLNFVLQGRSSCRLGTGSMLAQDGIL